MSYHDKLVMQFDNREAIYVEKGVLRVRVFNIRPNPAGRSVSAEVEEIPTPGLGVGIFRAVDESLSGNMAPDRWRIGAGSLTTFSDNTWEMGYGGWTIFFERRVVEGIVSLSADWSEKSDDNSRYIQILKWLEDNEAYENTQRVFPDD